MVVKTHHVDPVQVFYYGSHRILPLAGEEEVNRKVDSSGQQERLPVGGAGFFYEREPPTPPSFGVLALEMQRGSAPAWKRLSWWFENRWIRVGRFLAVT